MFSREVRTRIRALGADPDALGQLRNCAVLRAQPTDYFGLGCRHERSVLYDLVAGRWHLNCTCGTFGIGDSLLDAVDGWNEHLACYAGVSSGRQVRAARRLATNVVALRGDRR